MTKLTLEEAKSSIIQNTFIHSRDGIMDDTEKDLITKSISIEYDIGLGPEYGPVFEVRAEFNTIEEAVEAYNAIRIRKKA